MLLTENELIYFELLKKDVVQTFTESHSITKDVLEWKGDIIILFQEDLLHKVKGSVSEKWFYTYFKNSPKKLPRIDMLNLLSVYCGYNNWETYKAGNTLNKFKPTKKRYLIRILAITLLLVTSLIALKVLSGNINSFQFCFVDDDKKEIITHTRLDIKILKENESPIYLKTNNQGCFNYNTNESSIQFVVSSPYYKTDTIIRNIANNYNEQIAIRTDYYALMMHYLASEKKQDWKKLRDELNDIIAEDAKIYRVFPNSVDIIFYSKKEFINKLTLPTNDLKNLQILNKQYSKEKIIALKFMIK